MVAQFVENCQIYTVHVKCVQAQLIFKISTIIQYIPVNVDEKVVESS